MVFASHISPNYPAFISILCVFCTVPPSPPSGLNAFAVDKSSISIRWTNGFDGYSPLVFVNISYSVNRYPQDGISVLSLPLITSANLSGLYPYSSYSIAVKLTNAVNLTSNPSNIVVTTLSLSEFQLYIASIFTLYEFSHCIHCRRTNFPFHHQNCVHHC